MNIVLVGFMGSGKSRIGRVLSGKLGWAFIDTDDLVMKETGEPIARTIREKGEVVFRDIESRVIRGLASTDKSVIATGGGAPVSPENFERLKALGTIVWLRVTADTVLRRVGDLSTRPLIDPTDPRGSVERRMQERAPAYARAAVVVDADKDDLASIADDILSRLRLPS